MPVDKVLDFVGILDVIYSISAGNTSAQFSVSITVLTVTAAPSLTRYNGPGSIAEDSEIVFAVSDFAISDSDGSDESFSISILDGDNFSVNLNGDGLIPDPNFYGLLGVNVIATDQDGASSPVYGFDLSVYGVNDAPVVKDVAISPAVPAIDNDLTLSFFAIFIEKPTKT